MSHYLLIYRADPADAAADAGPDGGDVGRVVRVAGPGRVSDGRLRYPTVPVSADADPTVGGYSLVEADSHDAALALLADHPHTAMGGRIDVYEVTPFAMG